MSFPPSVIDRKTLDFLIFDVFALDSVLGVGRYAEHDRESICSVLDLAEQIANNDLWTHREKSDRKEPWMEDGEVRIIAEAIDALNVMKKAGFFSAHADYALGGMQLPVTINHACNGMFKGANVGTASYMGLTRSAANLLQAHADDDMKQRYMLPLLQGRFFGTMCLSEPEVGSSLIDTRTRAELQEDGSYVVTGTKMWISGGDQDASENIIHLVLARTADAPAGLKGLSLFAVPKFLVNDDGSIGRRNGVTVTGLNHKMGYRGTSNCLLNFSESGGQFGNATGHLVGKPGKGLYAMFLMMNESRISIGTGAAMLSSVAYRIAVDYARERVQGRSLSGQGSEDKPVPIITHPDVRRMLMRQKVYSEGAIALCLYAGTLIDREELAESHSEREHLSALLEVVTPVVKAWSSEFGVEANKLAIQVLGGYGYTRDFPVEQLYRDNRLNMIHEGTNGIQALDLLGRKLTMDDGAMLHSFCEELEVDFNNLKQFGTLEVYVSTLDEMLKEIVKIAGVTRGLISDGQRAQALVNATPFMHAFGHLVVGWLWLKQCANASRLLKEQSSEYDPDFLQGKINACRYFFDYEIPEAITWLSVASSNPLVLLGIDEDEF